MQEKNRLQQKGLLKRFNINCIGHQETVEEMRAEKTEKFTELKDKKGTPEYEEWFLRYRPLDPIDINNSKNEKKSRTKTKTKRVKNTKNRTKTKKSKSKKMFGIKLNF